MFHTTLRRLARAFKIAAVFSSAMMAIGASAEEQVNPQMAFHPGPDRVYDPQPTAIVPPGTAITMTTNIPKAKIYYTINGLSPTTASTIYRRPLELHSNATFRAIALGPNGESSGTEMMQYVIYMSPYRMAQFLPIPDLESDFAARDAALVTMPPREQWNKKASYPSGRASWGPRAEQYGAPDFLQWQDPEWQRQRVADVAASYIDTQYQHHHILDWTPMQSWSMGSSSDTIRLGHQSRGIDAPNFISWVYNFGLGISIPDDIRFQSKMTAATQPDKTGSQVTVLSNVFARPTFAWLVSQLKMGDLIFVSDMRDRNEAAHVAMWIGQDSVSGDYLVIDSYPRVGILKDASGNFIPSGVQLRPFRENSMYYRNFHSAVRIIQ